MALSDLLGPALQVGSTILKVGSALSRASATQAIAARRQASSQFEAEQLRIAAQEAVGVGMRAAANETMKAQLVNSTALARAAASGAGASDPTVMAILARTQGEGAYRSALAMYEGEAQARLTRMRAAAAEYEGKTGVEDASAASQALRMSAADTVLTGGVKAMTLYDRFWAGPKTTIGNTYDMPQISGSGWSDAGTALPDDIG